MLDISDESHRGLALALLVQYLVPILRDPDQVILNIPNRVKACPMLAHLRHSLHFRGRMKLTANRRWD